MSGEGCLKDVPKTRPSAQLAEQLHADAREKRLSFKFTCLCLYFGFRNLCPREPLSFPSNLRRLVASSQVEERKIRRNLWSRCTSLHERKMKLPAFFYRFWRSSRQGWEEGVGIWHATPRAGEAEITPHVSSQRFDSLYGYDPPIRNQGLISQLTASSSIISIQTN